MNTCVSKRERERERERNEGRGGGKEGREIRSLKYDLLQGT